MVWKDGDTVTAVTVALIDFANATPWRTASSDRAEPSVGIKMCLYIAASSPGRAPSTRTGPHPKVAGAPECADTARATEPLDRRPAPLRFADHAHDLGEQGVATDPLGSHHE